METTDRSTWPFLVGSLTTGTLPAASAYPQMMAYCSDVGAYMMSDGAQWRPIIDKRIETYAGTTDASGNYSATYASPYSVNPNVQPVTLPPADSTTRVRITAQSTTGFTIKTERNAGVNLLGVDVLLLGTSNVPLVPVKVLVVEA